jgi:hypothetical protein
VTRRRRLTSVWGEKAMKGGRKLGSPAPFISGGEREHAVVGPLSRCRTSALSRSGEAMERQFHLFVRR